MIALREIRPEDKDMMREWRNLPQVAKYMFEEGVIGKDEHEKWFQRITKNENCRYWVTVCDDKDIGIVNIYNINERHGYCYFAFYIVDTYVRNRGVGSYIEYSILNYVFNKLKLNKLCCEVLAFNEPAIKMHKGFGFMEQGRLREHIVKGSERHDVVCLEILRSEWESSKLHLPSFMKGKELL